jgi:hypothetical protein
MAVLPGVGLVAGTGLLTMALFGLVGAAGGALAGGKLEDAFTQGLPKDELFFYEDALRQGRSVVIALTDEDEAERARAALIATGADDLDTARDRWWVGIRDAEEAHYDGDGDGFRSDEEAYRRGFEAALQPDLRQMTYDEAKKRLPSHHQSPAEQRAFKRGYERGQAYYQRLVLVYTPPERGER